MSTHGFRVLVAVFDLRERAERAAEQLRAEGADADRVQLLSGADTLAGCDVGAAARGVMDEAGDYYESELRAGRWLLVVSCPPAEAAQVLGAFGRHGGSVCVPPEVRDGRM